MVQEDMEKTIVAKPVATRLFSKYRPVSFSDTSIAIKPKTIRLKPKQIAISPEIISSMDKFSESLGEDLKDSILYKPTSTWKKSSLLANMENVSKDNAASCSQNLESDQSNRYYLIQTQSVTNYYPNPITNMSQLSDLSSSLQQNTERQTLETSLQTANRSVDRPSYDGYNWRKYGQKQVKGSEFPRSYYKCTHPNCPVKKKVETTHEGQIAEIVYKGEHNHSKPQPPKRQQCAVNSEDNNNNNNNNNNSLVFDGSIFEARMEGQNELGLPGFSSYYQGQDGNFATVPEIGGIATIGDTNRPNNKRRKNDEQVSGGNANAESETTGNTTPILMETDIIGDGFHWRKYGQKVVKGNPYPRSYYRCTSPKCSVRKYVEKASDNSGSFVTTYEGKHNHEAPSRRISSTVS